MPSFNKVILIGHMAADPELKTTTNGTSVCSFRIAVNRPKAKDGTAPCDFFDVIAWKNTAEFVCKYFAKGNPILVEGNLQNRSYTDKNNQKRTVNEVVAHQVTFVGKRGEANEDGVRPVADAKFTTVDDLDDLPL